MNAKLAAHLSPEILASYFTQGLDDDRQIQVEEHLAGCAACTRNARLAYTGSGLIDHWTARLHGEAARRAILVQAIAAARGHAGLAEWRQRLGAWADRWSGQAEAALRIVLEAPGQAARVITDGLDDLTRPGTAWQLAPVSAAVPTRGLARTRGASQPTVVTASAVGAPTVRVAVSGERGEIVVRLDHIPPGTDPPLVLLVTAEQADRPRLAAPELGPGSDSWIARFEGLGPGDYIVAFEPLG